MNTVNEERNYLKVVVTGATSMIGSALIEAFLHNGVEKIYAIVREDTTKIYRIPINTKICIIKCNADNYDSLIERIENKCDLFYHFAWSLTGKERNNNIDEQIKNISYTLNALRVAKELGCEKFIGAGSQAEYGKLNIDYISEASPINPIQAYGIAKYTAGKVVLEEANNINIDCFWVRIFSVYGKYDKESSMINYAINKFIKNEETEFTLAKQKWDYLYRDDAGEAFYYIGLCSKGRKVYCLGSGKCRELSEFIIDISKETGYTKEIGFGKKELKDCDDISICADISLLQKDTNWKPKTSFIEGIKKQIEYIKTNKRYDI